MEILIQYLLLHNKKNIFFLQKQVTVHCYKLKKMFNRQMSSNMSTISYNSNTTHDLIPDNFKIDTPTFEDRLTYTLVDASSCITYNNIYMGTETMGRENEFRVQSTPTGTTNPVVDHQRLTRVANLEESSMTSSTVVPLALQGPHRSSVKTAMCKSSDTTTSSVKTAKSMSSEELLEKKRVWKEIKQYGKPLFTFKSSSLQRLQWNLDVYKGVRKLDDTIQECNKSFNFIVKQVNQPIEEIEEAMKYKYVTSEEIKQCGLQEIRKIRMNFLPRSIRPKHLVSTKELKEFIYKGNTTHKLINKHFKNRVILSTRYEKAIKNCKRYVSTKRIEKKIKKGASFEEACAIYKERKYEIPQTALEKYKDHICLVCDTVPCICSPELANKQTDYKPIGTQQQPPIQADIQIMPVYNTHQLITSIKRICDRHEMKTNVDELDSREVLVREYNRIAKKTGITPITQQLLGGVRGDRYRQSWMRFQRNMNATRRETQEAVNYYMLRIIDQEEMDIEEFEDNSFLDEELTDEELIQANDLREWIRNQEQRISAETTIRRLIDQANREEKETEANTPSTDILNQMLEEGLQNKLTEQIKEFLQKHKNSEKAEIDITLPSSLSIKEFVHAIPIPKDHEIYIYVHGTFYNLNMLTRSRILKTIEEGDMGSESDEELLHLLQDNKNIKIYIFKKRRSNKARVRGAYFPYQHTLPIDLRRYGIYKTFEAKNYKENCLIKCLRHAGIPEANLDKIKMSLNNRCVPARCFSRIASQCNIKIRLTKLHKDKARTVIYNDDATKEVNIGLILDHYFLNESTGYQSYFIKNWREVQGEHNPWEIIGVNKNKIGRDKNGIKSFALIKCLVNHPEHLKEPDKNKEYYKSQFYDKPAIIDKLEYIPEEVRRYGDTKKKYVDRDNYKNVFFDFECSTDGQTHKPFMCCIERDSKFGMISKTYKGEYCGKNMLDDLQCNTQLIAHNCGYDIRFLIPHIKMTKLIQKGKSLIYATGIVKNKFGRIKIKIKDSYKLISSPLRNFGNIFGLDQSKEVMPYNAYTEETTQWNRGWVVKRLPYKWMEDRLPNRNDADIFRNNCEKWNLIIKENNIEMVDHMKYCKIYCEKDVEVLRLGYNKFRSWILEEPFKIDIDNIISGPSLAMKYMEQNHVYDDIYELSGKVREFVSHAIVGGRCMTRQNKKWHVRKKLNDFDGVSLYPSAMNRVQFPKGKPKPFTTMTYEELQTKDHYVVEINITKINKHQNFPLISKLVDGVRQFKNDLTGIHIVDKITLEDYIEFHQIEFEIVRGYLWDEGFNDNIQKVIKKLFNERLKYKKDKNPIQQVYKLIMNSAYGKTIMRPIDTNDSIFNDEAKKDKFLRDNSNWVKSFSKIADCNQWLVKSIKPIHEHYNMGHIGGLILSMSKRIMNEVMCLAEDLTIPIYYQDTDSMHIEDDKIPKLEKEFKNKYNRELIGKNMGQFHCDFSFPSDVTPVAIESIFVGKKCYLDKVECCQNDKRVYFNHIRMKGIPTIAVEQCGDPVKVYKDLLKGEGIEFSCPNVFNYNRDLTISKLNPIIKKIRFPGNQYEIV